jgi:hypothetical protein
MLQFGAGRELFLYRVAAVVVNDGRVLAQRIGDQDFLACPAAASSWGSPPKKRSPARCGRRSASRWCLSGCSG